MCEREKESVREKKRKREERERNTERERTRAKERKRVQKSARGRHHCHLDHRHNRATARRDIVMPQLLKTSEYHNRSQITDHRREGKKERKRQQKRERPT